MANFTPDPVTSLTAAVGSAYSQKFHYQATPFVVQGIDIGLVTGVGSSTYLQAGATVFPGVTIETVAGGYPTEPDITHGVTISGTPTVAGNFTFYVRAQVSYEGGGTGYEYATYTVNISGPALTLTPASPATLTAGSVGNPYASGMFTISNGQGPYRVNITSAVPAGIGLNTNPTTPTPLELDIDTAGNFYVVGVPQASGVFSLSFLIRDLAAAREATFSSYSLTINTTGSGTLVVTQQTVTPTTGLEFGYDELLATFGNVTYTATGGSGNYTWSTSGFSGFSPSILDLLTNTGQLSESVTTASVNLNSGTGTLTMGRPGTYAGNIIAVDTTNALINGSLPVSLVVKPGVYRCNNTGDTPSAPPNGTVGVQYNGSSTGYLAYFLIPTAYSSSSTITVAVSSGSLPTGLSLDLSYADTTLSGSTDLKRSKIGIIGTPAAAGTFAFSLTVSGTGGTGSVSKTYNYSITITGSGSGTISLAPSNFDTVLQLDSITPQDITASGGTGPYSWLATGTIPSGLSLTPSTNILTLSGTATGYTSASGNPINVSITGATGSGSGTYNIVVNPTVFYSLSGSASAQVGIASTRTLAFVGGDGTNFAYSVSGLPPGLTAVASGAQNANLVISGTPTTVGTYPISIIASVDAVGRGVGYRASQLNSFTMTVTSGVAVTPFTTTLCVLTNDSFILGASVVGGSANTYTITGGGGFITGISGTFNSGELVNLVGTAVGTYPLTLTSVDNPLSTATVTVTVSNSTAVNSSINPAGPINLYDGQYQSFLGSASGGCSSSANSGAWDILESGHNDVISGVSGNGISLGLSSISSNFSVTLRYRPYENPSNYTLAIVNFISGSSGALTITTSSPLPAGTSGAAYSQTLATTGATGSVTWAITSGTLPSGLTLGSSTGAITGTPTTNGSYSFTVSATDSVTSTSKAFTLDIGGGSASITNLSPASGTVLGGTVVELNGTGFLAGDLVIFQARGTTTPIFATYTPSATTAVKLTFTTTAWAALNYSLCDVQVVRSSTVIAEKASGWSWTGTGSTMSINSVSPISSVVNAGNLSITINGQGFDGSCVAVYHDNPLVGSGVDNNLTTTFISSTQLTATIPSTFFVASNYAGTVAQIKVKRNSDNNTVTYATSFSITADPPVITTTSLPNAVGDGSTPYSATLTVTGGVGPYTWSVLTGALPDGLSINSSTGTISGTPQTSAVTSSPTFQVVDSGSRTATKVLQIQVVNTPTFTITTTTPLDDARVNQLYTKTLAATGGTTPYTWYRTSGTLPDGLTLQSGGVITGTPTLSNPTPSSWNFTIRAVDSTGGTPLTTDKAFSITLLQALSVVTVTAITPIFGPVGGGTPVTITGTGFLPGAVVRFGNNVASNVQVSSTSITCVTPAGTAGFVSVTVINTDLGFGVLTNGFEYRTIVSPVISGLDIQDGPFIGGQTITLIGSSFTGITSVRFGVTDTPSTVFEASITSIDDASVPNTLVCVTPAYTLTDGTSKVDVSIFATNPSGIGSLPAGDTSYTYRPAPIITSVVPSSGPTTGGSTVYVIGKNFFTRGNNKPRILIGNVEVPAENITLIEE